MVATRPGFHVPHSDEEFPPGLRTLVAAHEKNFVQLTTGRHIEFLYLKDVDVAASDVRKRVRTGKVLDRHLSFPVEQYIREQGLYGPLGPRIGDYGSFTEFCADVLFAKKAIAVKGFDLRAVEAPSEFALVASGTSTRHASALAENVMRAVKEEFNVFPQSVEGIREGRWILLDYGALIVHVFYDFVRQEYRMEELWRGGLDLSLKDKQAP